MRNLGGLFYTQSHAMILSTKHKRYIETVTNAGIIDESEGIIFPHNDFSIQTKNPIRNSHKADPFSAGVIFSNLLARKT